ncbi:MAG TPA: F0F1 ATP synthase subunit delta [Thermomicrobiales bacterium]|nr:F0F1 ATP synthase subunit delta [Thermomicrobiales bacterium]
MAARGVAKRYAQATFDIARESGTEQQWLEDLTTLANAAGDPSLGDYFTSPNIAEQAKLDALGQILPAERQQLARNLASMLVQRRRFDVLPELLEVYRDLLLQAQGVAIAEVTTAVELSPAEQQAVQAQLAQAVGQQIEMRMRVDPSLVGGLVARIGDWLIDGSVESQLRNLRASLAR